MSENIALKTVATSLSPEIQRLIVSQIRTIAKAAPFRIPETPGGQPFKILMTAAGSLGWTSDRKNGYRYSDIDQGGNRWPSIPDEWLEIAVDVGGNFPWDSAIINWYPPSSSLGWHADISERDLTYPIVTISIGDSAVWSIKPNKKGRAHRCTIGSGDVTLLSGELRSWYHSIERIIPMPILSPLDVRGRLSVTIRVAG